jgi:hypothetical protein
MAFNVDRFRQEERTRTELVKQRGDIIKTSEVLGLPIEYVEKIQRKLNGLTKRNVSVFAQNQLMSCLITGSESRIRHLMEMIQYLDSTKEGVVSSCHKAMVIVNPIIPEEDPEHIICKECGNPCTTKVLHLSETFEMKKQLIEQLRAEDDHMLKYAEKLGFTEKKDEPSVRVDVRQQNLVLNGANISGELKLAMSKNGPLTGMDREQIRKALEKKLLLIESSNSEDEGVVDVTESPDKKEEV